VETKADQSCVWPFVVGQIFWAQVSPTAYRLFARSVCVLQRRCSWSCRLWRYISVMPYLLHFSTNYRGQGPKPATNRGYPTKPNGIYFPHVHACIRDSLFMILMIKSATGNWLNCF